MNERDSEIDGLLEYIHQHIYEPLPLNRLASLASYSPYHFARIFKERTGLPPLYYISSLRLQKAKDLLLRTNLSVRDIALEIGQQSLGTFTTRFTERVGVTPSQFRDSAPLADNYLRSLRRLDNWITSYAFANQHATIKGTVQAETHFEGIALVGLFGKPIPEGLPIYGTLAPTPGTFCFSGVRPGIYYLMATSVSWGMQTMDFLLPHSTLRAKFAEPIVVGPQSSNPHDLQVILRAPRLDDPPILISIPLLMKTYLNKVVKIAIDKK
ncbi:helix-turn-helix domain-containing protein [Paenibacillus alkalitolerans]|uniref:helix-turn-helix domain-containing protein n=1 Tax=Paenibacillus alkalitolerans TaxID=2799335 RepID=UPI0018F6954C|nr:helix-turn-helix transcriptional regulator [Paenibacillus alkalitolerans]